MIGRISSFQSLGAVDGPGLRYVIFMQGCPLRCIYCHNPETWDYDGGNEYSVDEVVEKVIKYKGYFGKKGGVTVTGGEPLMQAEFLEELFIALHKEGINTCIDTSGACDLTKARRVLEHTDLVLCDLKFKTDEEYIKYTGMSIKPVFDFLNLTKEMKVPIWIRQVIVPNINDDNENIEKFNTIIADYDNIEKVELLPFRKLCLEKYEEMDMTFPLKDTEEMDTDKVSELQKLVKINK